MRAPPRTPERDNRPVGEIDGDQQAGRAPAGEPDTHLAVTRKRVTSGAHRVETGHSLPVRLPPATEAAVHREVDAAIRGVGIRHGASHTEVIVEADGRRTVIEIAARFGTGQISP